VSVPEDYFAAAYSLMSSGDPSQVTIDALCRCVGTTSGSFYHHFGSMAGFVSALATDWCDRSIAAVAKAAIDAPTVVDARRLLHESILATAHPVEAALRAWARTNPTIRDAVERADDLRLETARRIIEAMLPNEPAADVTHYARIAQLILIGAQSQRADGAAELTTQAMTAFVHLLERVPDAAPGAPRRRSARRG
jgi:AcrR family transcriptional regulator